VTEVKNEIYKKCRRRKVGKHSLVFAAALLCIIVIAAGCDDVASNSPNVAPVTDYPVQAGTVPETGNTNDTAPQTGTDSAAAPADAGSAEVSTDNTATTAADISEVAQQVIHGDWGNGGDRVDALTNAGYDASEVQAQVDKMLQNNSTGGGGEAAGADDSGSSDNDNGSQVTWHDEITEPIYEDQPVFKWNFTFTISKYGDESLTTAISYESDYIYETQYAALAEARTYATAALEKQYSSLKLDNTNFKETAASAQKQTGTKKVQTGTRTLQKAGWY